jgi:uncharacterized protein YndB with AHSA1/START domain
MRWVLKGLAVLAAVVLLAFLYGSSRPEGHAVSTQARYQAAPESVWAALTDFERWPEWNPEVESVAELPDRNGHRVLGVVGSWGSAPTEVAVVDPPRRLRTEMDAGDFAGSWSYELTVVPEGGTLLTVTEEGRVRSPFIRAMMVFHDDYATMEAFHRALGNRLGETVEPERLGGTSTGNPE